MWFSASKKAKEDIWLQGFQAGFDKAWDMMMPMFFSGFEKVKKEIADSAKRETLEGLAPILKERHGTH